MGGQGSGRWMRYESRPTVTAAPIVDMRWVRRNVPLRPGVQLGIGQHGARVDVAWTPCRFGGVRPWFICPGCLRNRAKLHLVREHARCRVCLRMTYPSCRESDVERAMSRAQDLFQRLGGSGNISNSEPIPARPKAMRRRTYERIRQLAIEARADYWGAIGAYMREEDRRLADLGYRLIRDGSAR